MFGARRYTLGRTNYFRKQHMRESRKNLRDVFEKRRKGYRFVEMDIMLGGRYQATIHYPYHPLFGIGEDEVRTYVEDLYPTLKGSPWNVIMDNPKKKSK